MSETRDTIAQLNSAREIVLKDAAIYPQVISGVLPVIGPERPLGLRRWGADFLAETFASPVVSAEEKQKLCLGVLDTLGSYLLRKEERGEDEDWSVVKSAIQCAASIYPLVFRHVVSNADDAEAVWKKMASMKSSILRRMDAAPGGVRICCIKFVARVVQVQTPGLIADPRRPEQNEVSLALVPRDHKIIPPTNLEAEASGLLDRLLGVLQDNSSDALVATATLNALSSLVQRRASIAPKILATVLSFNPLTPAARKMEGKDKVAVKSMTRTTMSFLLNVLKRNPNHALAGRIQQHVERLRVSLVEVFSEQNPLKRSAPDEPIDGLADDKRLKLDHDIDRGSTPAQQQPALPPVGPVSLAQLFTLTNDLGAAGFHVEAIPQYLVSQLVPPLIASINQAQFDTAINTVKARYLEVQRRPPPVATSGDDEDDDYDPSMGFGDGEQIANQMDQLPPLRSQPELAIASFHLPPPPPLTSEEIALYSETAKDRLLMSLHELDTQASKKPKKQLADKEERGFNRLAATDSQDRDGWVALLTRLATRPTFESRADGNAEIKKENDERILTKKGQFANLPDKLREAFHVYVMDDWRRRLDIAIAWLNEEWYADRLASKLNAVTNLDNSLPNYTRHALSVLDSLIPYIDTKDGRHLIRFLSEIPFLPSSIWPRIAKLAEDPERVTLVSQCLLYLIMFRPPVREEALDCAEGIWGTNEGAKGAVGKVLTKWRPRVLEGGKGIKAETIG